MTFSVNLDIETRSTVDLAKTGVYRYAEAATTDVLVVCWSTDGGETVERCDPRKGCPAPLADAVIRGATFHAFNAAFERPMWEWVLSPRYGWPMPSLGQWRCTMAKSAQFGCVGSLNDVATILGLKIEKDAEGRRLMLQMCKPRGVRLPDGTVAAWNSSLSPARKAEAEANPETLVWRESEEDLKRLADYCEQDVRVEAAIDQRLPPLPESEQHLYELDQRINDRGVEVDLALVDNLIELSKQAEKRINEQLREITEGKVRGAKDHRAMLDWLQSQGVDVKSVDKETVENLLGAGSYGGDVDTALALRREGSKNSVAKLAAMKDALCHDGRIRGLFKFNGARTRRWSGQLVQPQNLPRDYQDPRDVFD